MTVVWSSAGGKYWFVRRTHPIFTTTHDPLMWCLWWWWRWRLGFPPPGWHLSHRGAGGGVGGRSGLARLGTTTASPPHPAWCGDCTAQCAVHPTDGGAPAVLPLLPHPLAPPARHIASSLHPAGCRAGAGGGTSKDPTLPVDWVPIQPAGSLGSVSV